MSDLSAKVGSMNNTAMTHDVESTHALNPSVYKLTTCNPRRFRIRVDQRARLWPADGVVDGRADYTLDQGGLRYTFRVDGPPASVTRFSQRRATSGVDRYESVWYQPVRVIAIGTVPR